ncbi:MAG: aldehyde ferredoxin oxidoreductase C-terminal domain-containing protein [Thermodesulfobacteriota bacterium]|nr:aldehyde ferredoxin oxidoreductase C-terminal domain-containing protein [Thermodesulfobacteriota bacterium]
MEYFGYAGCILHINLTSEDIRKEPLDMELAKKFIGGFGLNNILAYNYTKPDIDALSPENTIVLGAGALGGTVAPGIVKSSLTTKQPMTNSIGTGQGGGGMGCILKLAGYDHVIITGKASRPVYLLIEDEPKILDADHLWGKDMVDTTRALWKEHDPCSVYTIGTAGEKLVRPSVGFVDLVGSLGRGGMPAVLGSKNLKAIVARPGERGIRIKDPVKFMTIVDEIQKPMVEDPLRPAWREHGVLIGWPTWAKGGFNYRNYTTYLSEKESLACYDPDKFYSSVRKILLTCPTCPVGDKGYWEIFKGEHAGLGHFGSELLQMAIIGGVRLELLDEYNKGIKLMDMANRFGIDLIEASSLLSWYVELQDRGILTAEDTDGVELKNDYDSFKMILEKINNREGLGDILADGRFEAMKKIGRGCEKYAVHCKGLDPLFLDPRITFNPEAFEQVINPRGATAVTAEGPLILPMRTSDKVWRHCDRMHISDEIKERIFDSPEEFNTGMFTRYLEDWYHFYSCLGVCARQQVHQRYNFEYMYDLFTAATGMDISEEEILKVGERVVNTVKALNVREGFSRKDDIFPDRWYEPMRSLKYPEIEKTLMDYYETKERDKEDIEKMKNEYYAERGWNVKKGIPTREKLEEIGLGDLAQDLTERCKI